MKKSLVSLTVAPLALLFTLVSCGGTAQTASSVTDVALNQSEIELSVGESKTLKATMQPGNVAVQTVNWISSDTAIASVANGRVKGESPGKATITAITADGGKTDTCAVTVKAADAPATVPVTGVTVSPKALNLTAGQNYQVTATVQPDNAAVQTVSWVSSDSSVATVANGLVTAIAPGAATITAITTDGGKTDTCVVTVKADVAPVTVPVTGVTVSPKALNLTVCQSHQVTATVQPGNAAVQTVNWASSDSNVATVANGLVTAIAPGAATITAITTDGGKTDTCVVTVKADVVPVTGVTVSPKTLNLTAGHSHRIAAIVQPNMAAVKTVNWASSDSSVATVANGIVTAIAQGAATITATTTDGGKTDTCAVTVKAAGYEPDVYVAGYESGAAALWVNGVSQYLTYSNTSNANSVFVSGSDVYVAGYENSAATLWINGVPKRLNEGATNAKANSVFVSGSDVYVAGHELLQSHYVATLWVNGVPQRLTDGKYQSGANTVFVSGSDVYVTGHEYVREYGNLATLWVNGVPQRLSLAPNACANSVFVSGSNVYVAGHVFFEGRNHAALWVNGVPQYLSHEDNAACANSVFVSGNDVYVAGEETIGRQQYGHATLWVNGVPQRLTNGTANACANSVFVLGGDVYVTGYENATGNGNLATLWVNGVPQRLGPVSDAHARAVFVDKGGAVSGISLEPALTLAAGQAKTLAPAILPINALNKSVTWSSDKPEVASVDGATGKVTARAPGTAAITATTQDGGYTASCIVTVTLQ